MKVKCPNCKAICFETTDKFNPDVTPNGSMVRKLVPWHIDWLCSSTTLASEMVCPKCGVGQLAPSGRLTLVPDSHPPAEISPAVVREDADDGNIATGFVCEICGKVCKNKFGLDGHMQSHKKEARL
jgi:hypothetical protein